MSTEPSAPRTRAEARALRAAAEAAAPADAVPAEQDVAVAAAIGAPTGTAPAGAVPNWVAPPVPPVPPVEVSAVAQEQDPAQTDSPVPTSAPAPTQGSAHDQAEAQRETPAPTQAQAEGDDIVNADTGPRATIAPPEVSVLPADVGQAHGAGPRRRGDATFEELLAIEDAAAENETTQQDAPERNTRRFGLILTSVIGILAVVGASFAVVSLFQGPRLSSVTVDERQAIETSGSRVILTSNQVLAEIDPSQVTVEPAVPFTVDAAGRDVGVRFTVPLDDSTEYTVRVEGVSTPGGGPSADLVTTFTTPASEAFLLVRDAEGDSDKIFRTDLTGETGVPVFSADKINDFRATSTSLVVAVEGEAGSQILVMNRDGSDQRELDLPGDGFVTSVQVSDRGGLVGYSYSDRELSETSGRASVLVTQPLDGSGKPHIVEISGKEASVDQWRFVPDSSALIFIDFSGALSLEDQASDAGVKSLGLAMTIQGVSRGTYTAIIERTEGEVVELNLTDGSEEPLAASSTDFGTVAAITPFPGGTLRHVIARDENGIPTGQSVVRVDEEGAADPIVEVGKTDSILQTCSSPSGQYAAVVVAPNLADNPYDDLLAPLPTTMHTHLINMRTGEEFVALRGFDFSWCATAPTF